MEHVWQRLEIVLRNYKPKIHFSLRPGAPESKIIQAEQRLSIRLPLHIRNSLGIHDGQALNSPCLKGDWRLLPLSELVEAWELWRKILNEGGYGENRACPSGPIKPLFWSPSWIPFAGNDCGDFLCLDLAPAPKGQVGQVIAVFHDDDQRLFETESYRSWLEEITTRLEKRANTGKLRRQTMKPEDWLPATPGPFDENAAPSFNKCFFAKGLDDTRARLTDEGLLFEVGGQPIFRAAWNPNRHSYEVYVRTNDGAWRKQMLIVASSEQIFQAFETLNLRME